MRADGAAWSVEDRRNERHPISRWYVGPVAARFARWLSPSWVRPTHLTLAGLAAAAAAAVVLLVWPTASPVAAVLVLGAWFLDRSDGLLARRQQTATAWGAWLDGNIDELTDVGLHVAVASAASRLTGSQWPWFLLIGFLAGKYLFLHGLYLEREQAGEAADSAAVGGGFDAPQGLLWRCYHLPGNADIRVHLLVVALLTGWLTVELALVAAYYNLRWTARYFLVARRLGDRS